MDMYIVSSFLKLNKSNISKKIFKPKVTLYENKILDSGYLHF